MDRKVKDRIRILMAERRMTQRALAEKVDVSLTTISKILSTDGGTGIGTLQRIAVALGVQINWLLNGTGEKYLKSEQEMLAELEERGEEEASALKFLGNNQSVPELIFKIQSLEEEIRRLRYNQDSIQPGNSSSNSNLQNDGSILLVDSRSASLYPEKYQDNEYLSSLASFSLPSSRFRNGFYRAFEIQNDSMKKRINRGDWAIGFKLSNYSLIRDGFVYIIVLEDEVVCKRLVNRITERGRLRLKSDNPTFSDYEIEIEQVREVWEVKGIMSFDLSNPDLGFIEWMTKMEDSFFEMKEEIGRLRGKG